MMRAPNMMLCSLNKLMVQKGRSKSWWSMWGGMQSSASYTFTMAVSGSFDFGKMPHLNHHVPRVNMNNPAESTSGVEAACFASMQWYMSHALVLLKYMPAFVRREAKPQVYLMGRPQLAVTCKARVQNRTIQQLNLQ